MKQAPNNPLAARARELGIAMVDRDVIPNTRRAHEATEFARRQGALAPFHGAVLRAYWSEGRDIHDWAVLRELAGAVGLDGAAMQAAVDAGELRAAVDDRVEAGRDLGIHAVPSFVVGDRYLVEGAQTAEVFEKVIGQLRRG